MYRHRLSAKGRAEAREQAGDRVGGWVNKKGLVWKCATRVSLAPTSASLRLTRPSALSGSRRTPHECSMPSQRHTRCGWPVEGCQGRCIRRQRCSWATGKRNAHHKGINGIASMRTQWQRRQDALTVPWGRRRTRATNTMLCVACNGLPG